MGITVVSLLQNMRGSTLGRERAHYSDNKSVRSKYQEFSKKIQEKRCLFQRFLTSIVASRIQDCPEFPNVAGVKHRDTAIR